MMNIKTVICVICFPRYIAMCQRHLLSLCSVLMVAAPVYKTTWHHVPQESYAKNLTVALPG